MERRRYSISELYGSPVEEIAELVKKAAKSYERVEDMTSEVAVERALADYTFWYNDDKEKKNELEKLVYRKINKEEKTPFFKGYKPNHYFNYDDVTKTNVFNNDK